MDRLTSFIYYGDPQTFDQAVMVARRHAIDWTAVEDWAKREGADASLLARLRRRVERA